MHTRTMRKILLFGPVVFALIAACSGRGDVGESCKTGGSTDECVSGSICSKTISGAQTCQKVCVDQKDCPTGTTCNGVTGSSTKSCRPDA